MLNNIPLRILRKLKLLQYINISKQISFENHSITIPVINELGYPNVYLKSGWFSKIANELFTGDGQTFIDVGANIGQTLIAVKSIDKNIQYIGFEPDASCRYYIKKLIQHNHFEHCLVYNFGLSDRLKEDFLETNGEADPTQARDDHANFDEALRLVTWLCFR